MNLRAYVLHFVNLARRSPTKGSDPDVLNGLERKAQDDWEGLIGALHAPIAPLTWEIKLPLLGSQPEGTRKQFKFPYKAEIVGMRPIVLATAAAIGGGGKVPTVDDIEISMDLSNEFYMTNTNGPNGNAVAGSNVDGTYVTLGALSVETPRLMCIRPDGLQPEIGFTPRWAIYPSGGPAGGPVSGPFDDVLIKISMFARRIG